MKTFPTTCLACPDKCPCIVHVENGKVIKVTGHPESPLNQGFPERFPLVPFMCEKGRYADIELMYHPKRILYPMKRIGERGEGRWKRITWDEALNTITEKIVEIREKYGAPSLCCTGHGANSRECQLMLTLFMRSLGSPNVVSNTDICAGAGEVADKVSMGEDIIRPWFGPIDLRHSKCILVAGANLFSTYPSRWRDILYAMKNGAKLIVIDPRRTEMAERADIHLQLRPGTDGLLALSMLNVVVNENLYDKGFVDQKCLGFEELREHVQGYTPEKVENTTDIKASLIKETARMFATIKPACMIIGEGKEQQIAAVQTTRAYTSLLATTGNIGKFGTNCRVKLTKGFKQKRSYIWKAKEFTLPEEVEKKRIGYRQFPLWTHEIESIKHSHYQSVIKAMLYGDPYWVKFLWVETENPVVNRPNPSEIIKALKNLDFLVATDFQMTATTELADIILPQAMSYEYDEIMFVPFARSVQIRQKTVDPPGEVRYLTDVLFDLINNMASKGLADRRFIPWKTQKEFFEFLLEGTEYTFDDLKAKGFVEAIEPRYDADNFNTPSGKIELWSSILEKHGHSPLPIWMPPPDSEKPELIKKFPLILISGTREFIFNKSRYHDLSFATKVHPYPLAEIHLDVAKERDIKDGDWIWIIGVTGRCKMKAKVTDKIHPKTVNVPMGWWFPDKKGLERMESNVNMILPSDSPYETIMGAPILKSIACEVARVG